MAEKKFTVLDLLDLDLSGHDALHLKCIAGRRGLPRAITIPEINRPGLALSGFYENFARGRLQLFGRGETAYLLKLQFCALIKQANYTIKHIFKGGQTLFCEE